MISTPGGNAGQSTCWQFSGGIFTPIADPLPQDSGRDVDLAMRSAGYYLIRELGDVGEFSQWEASDKSPLAARFPYAVQLSPASFTWNAVWIATMADLLGFMAAIQGFTSILMLEHLARLDRLNDPHDAERSNMRSLLKPKRLSGGASK